MKCINYFDKGNQISILVLVLDGKSIASDEDPSLPQKTGVIYFCEVVKVNKIFLSGATRSKSYLIAMFSIELKIEMN